MENHPLKSEMAGRLFGSKGAANPGSAKGKGEGVKWYEDLNAVVDALGLCKFNHQRMLDDIEPAGKLSAFV